MEEADPYKPSGPGKAFSVFACNDLYRALFGNVGGSNISGVAAASSSLSLALGERSGGGVRVLLCLTLDSAHGRQQLGLLFFLFSSFRVWLE